MMGEHPNYMWSLNGKLQPPSFDQQIHNPTLFTTPPNLPAAAHVHPPSFFLNPPYHFESSVLVPAANPNYAFTDRHHHEIQDFPLSYSQLTMKGLANDLEQYNLGAGHVGEVKHAYILDGTSTNSNSKRPWVHHSTQRPLKVRKEKSGRDKVYALHQLVSPFGKTDMASVLSEATIQIKFFEDQIKALSSPYMNLANSVSEGTRDQHSADGKAAPKDLASRGLCLVPVTCMDHIDSTNMTGDSAKFWALALDGGFLELGIL